MASLFLRRRNVGAARSHSYRGMALFFGMALGKANLLWLTFILTRAFAISIAHLYGCKTGTP